MSNINANIVVEPIDLTIIQEDPGVTITQEPINLNIFAAGYAPPGGANLTLQFNDNGKLGGAPNTQVSNGNISFGNIGNVKITGGTNGYFLQTDGSGNLTWAQGTANVSGNGTADGANGLIQLSDGTGNFRSGSGFSFDTGTNALAVPGDVVSAGDFSGVDGNLSGNVVANNITANGIFTGDGGNLSNIPAGNLSGNIVTTGDITANNITANGIFTGTLATNAQPNITSLGTLTSLDVTGNITSGNANLGNSVTANFFIGDGSLLTGIDTAGISNGNSNVKVYANANIEFSAEGNSNVVSITGTTLFAGNANIANANINTQLRLNTPEIALGQFAALANVQNQFGIGIGYAAAFDNQGSTAIAIGKDSGSTNQGNKAIAIGEFAGYVAQPANSIAIGANAGVPAQAANTIVLNATGANLSGNSNANAFYVKPIRNSTTSNALFYDDSTGEITYGGISTSSISNGNSNVNIPSANGNVNISAVGNANVLVITGTGANINGNLLVSGNITGNLSNANFASFAGNVTVASQPNITTLGNLTNVFVTGTSNTNNLVVRSNSLAIGNSALSNGTFTIAIGKGSRAEGNQTIAIGENANAGATGRSDSIAIGRDARANGTTGISIGYNAGGFTQLVGPARIAIGHGAGFSTGNLITNTLGSTQAIAIGDQSASANQGNASIAIGAFSASNNQGQNSIAIGQLSGQVSQGSNSIAIGQVSGQVSQGSNSIAIGHRAGISNQANNTIIINATGSNLDSTTANTLTIKPIRNLSNTNVLMYDTTTGEISYDVLANYSGNITANNFNATQYVVLANDTAANIANLTGVAGAMISVNDQDHQPAYWSVTDSVWKYVSNRANVI